jgi:hypothetical protein
MQVKSIIIALSSFMLMLTGSVAQPVTGSWQGRISFPGIGLAGNYRMELKLVRNGDSLSGISYYYTGRNKYYRIPVKGYFNPYDGSVYWQHMDGLAEDETGRRTDTPIPQNVGFATDFNCPGEGIMKLDGEAEVTAGSGKTKNIPVHLTKTDDPEFPDESDDRMEDFAKIPDAGPASKPVKTADPSAPESKKREPITLRLPTRKDPPRPAPQQVPINKPLETKEITPPTITELFTVRKKILVTEIPLAGDTIELNFYDHAEIDGDSISIFLGNRLIEKNILLKASPYTLKIATKDLEDTNELTMVAENLGRIPPNTSLLIAYINGVRYEARLESTESTSAMVRFYRPMSK